MDFSEDGIGIFKRPRGRPAAACGVCGAWIWRPQRLAMLRRQALQRSHYSAHKRLLINMSPAQTLIAMVPRLRIRGTHEPVGVRLLKLVCDVRPSAVSASGFTALMPHPERVSRHVQMSWSPGDVSDLSPWARMYANARRWVA